VNERCFCVHHAEVETVVAAVGVAAGLSTCRAHAEGVLAPLDVREGRTPPNCSDCAPTTHRSYFVVEDRPRCIRHAADAVFADNDMRAHDMAHAVYIELNRRGVQDAY
jgi:hypothetical protein